MERWPILKPGRRRPVERHSQRGPRRCGHELFLACVMIQTAAIDSDTAAEYQRRDGSAVVQVAVIPMVHAGPHNYRAFASGFLGSRSKLARKLDHRVASNAREFLLPSRR